MVLRLCMVKQYEFARLVHLVTLFPLTKKTTDLVSWMAPDV